MSKRRNRGTSPEPASPPAPVSPEPVAAPAPALAAPAPARYRIRQGAPPHWDGSQLIPAGGVIVLRPGVRPGKWLDPIA